MKFINILTGLKNKEIVDLLKYTLNIKLESEYYASNDEIKDTIIDKKLLEDRLLVKLESENKERFLIVTLKPFDYQIAQYDVSFDFKIKKSFPENAEKHFERQKSYIKFMSQQCDEHYTDSVKDLYNKKADTIINRKENILSM